MLKKFGVIFRTKCKVHNLKIFVEMDVRVSHETCTFQKNSLNYQWLNTNKLLRVPMILLIKSRYLYLPIS